MGTLTLLSLPMMVGWAGWLAVGLALAMWARRARVAALAIPMYRPSSPRPTAVRPSSSVRHPVAPAPTPDAFSELQALLDPPESPSWRPGD